MKAKLSDTPVNYIQLSEELDALLERLESGDLNVDEAVAAYERGTEILKSLQRYLEQSEQRVMVLRDSLADEDAV